MKKYRVTLRVYNRADVLRGIELPEGLAVRAVNFVTQPGPSNAPAAIDEYVEIVCVENVEVSRGA